MSDLGAFLDMGGYAAYVWPAYVGSAVVLSVLCVASWRSMHRMERSVAASTAPDARVSVATITNAGSNKPASKAPQEAS